MLLKLKNISSSQAFAEKAQMRGILSPHLRSPLVVAQERRISKAVGIGTVRALVPGVARHLTTVLEVLLGILFLGSIGTFFLYVPILPVAAAVTIMLALILMFILGVQTGGRRIRVLRRKNASGSRVAECRSLNRAV
jgi:hypothetical protein